MNKILVQGSLSNQMCMQRKVMSFHEDKKSRQNSKQGHMNPLKIKTSFLRQSLNIGNISKNLALDTQNSPSFQKIYSSGYPDVSVQPQRKQDYMMKRIVERFSGNTSPTNVRFLQASSNNIQIHKDKQITRLLGCKDQHVIYQYPQKTSNQKYSNTHNSLLPVPRFFQTNHNLGFNQKNIRLSQGSTVQSVIVDSSLADCASNFNAQVGLQEPLFSVIQDQLQIILKRLAKNQCDVQTLKRDKNNDSHIQGVWKQLSLNQKRFQANQRKFAKLQQKIDQFGGSNKMIEQLKDQISQINSQNHLLSDQFKQFENNFSTQTDKINKKSVEDHQLFVDYKKLAIFERNLKIQIQNIKNKLDIQLQAKVQSGINFLKRKIMCDRITQDQQNNISHIPNNKKFVTLSQKKSHQFISIVYKQLIKVTKKSSFGTEQITQNLYKTSDHSKLSANAFNNINRKTNFSAQDTAEQATSGFSTIIPKLIDKPSQKSSQIQVNQVTYFIDPQGYLLDENQFYILNDHDQHIEIDSRMICLLKQNGVIKY